MAAAALALNVLGMIFLSHAVYSAYEHSLLPAAAESSTSSAFLPRSLDPNINLPLDVTLETLVALTLLCIGVVLSSPTLKPIQWNVWAGQLEKSKAAREIVDVGVGGGNPYEALEKRPGFVNIRAARTELGSWLNELESAK